jgi:protein TonB
VSASPDFLGTVLAGLRRPLARMLLLSLCLHAAVVMIVQPREVRVHDAVAVINARLISDKPAVAAPPPPPPAAETPATSEHPVVPLTTDSRLPEPKPLVPDVEAKPVPPEPPAQPMHEQPTKPVEQTTPTAPPSALPSIPVMVDTNWYEAKQLDVQPKASQPINPVYPPEARRRGQEGSVKLLLKIDEFGNVKEAEVEEGTPPGVFDESALKAFKDGHFQAAIRNGLPVRALIHVRVTYELGDD